MIRLVSTTVLNKLSEIPDKPGMTPAAAIIEWAARLCYNSNRKFGETDTFIPGLMKVGHYDVIEHASATFFVDIVVNNYTSFIEELLKLGQTFPYIKIFGLKRKDTYECEFYLTGNLRAWRESIGDIQSLFHRAWKFENDDPDINNLQYYLYCIAPHIFEDVLLMQASTLNSDLMLKIRAEYNRFVDANKNVSVAPIYTNTGAVVTLLGFTPLGFIPINHSPHIDKIVHVSFQIEHVSRAMTHQHVRHRLLSISQESQRYVDESGFAIVLPTKFTSQEQVNVFSDLVGNAALTYAKLRLTGAKKEDARSVLPNCAATRLVSSTYLDGWKHYIKLRTDKAAQEEIRLVADAIKSQINQLYESTI